MKTQIFNNSIGEAANIILSGGLCAVPTETVYGIACNGLDENAVDKIYSVKGRPSIKPLSLMVSDVSSIEKYCRTVPNQALLLAKKFWPGPLTIVLKAKKEVVPAIVRANGDTVGLRCPQNDLTLQLLREAGVPFAAPSANPSGLPSPLDAEMVVNYFDGKIDAVIDGGKCEFSRESTIIDMSSEPYRILRQGALQSDEIYDELVNGMTIIGISSGTGCGKTTALNEFKKVGALCIDCDEVYHSLLNGCEEMINEILFSFPNAAVNGVIDRKILGSVVFSNDDALKRLNSITHRYVAYEVMKKLRYFALNGGNIAVIDAVELFESGINKLCSFTLGIISREENRINRIMLRDGIDREYACKRIHAQKDDAYYRKHCTYIIENNDSECEFIKNINQLIKEKV